MAAEEQIAEKMKQGYLEAGGEAAGGVDAEQLAAIWKLLGQGDLASLQQGIALLRALEDAVVWASLAEGLSLDTAGRLVIPEGCEVHKRVWQPHAHEHRKLVALWALRQDGRLTGVQRLNLSRCTALTDLTPLAGLTGLQTLDLSSCTALTDLTGLAGFTGLRTLDLSSCTALTDLTPLAGLTGLQKLDLKGCTALIDLTPLAGLSGCFPRGASVTMLEFDVRSTFRADLWHDLTAGPWRVRIPGCETSEDTCRLVIPCSGPILDALRECLDAEAARGEGLRNLNVLLTSIEHDDWERVNSKYGETNWFFDKLALYFEEHRIESWWDGTSTRWRTYDIDEPIPEGKFTLGNLGDGEENAVPTIPPESLAVFAELIEEVRALRDGGDMSEDDRDNMMDILDVSALTVDPQWGMIITERTSWGSIGRGDVDPWEGPCSFDDPLEAIGILLERAGSAVPPASDRTLLWPVVLRSTVIENDDARERKWTAAERKRRLKLARTVVEHFSAAASATLDAETVYLFVGTANGEPGEPDYLTFDPSACRSGTGRWWTVADALDTLLDASNAACLDAIGEQFFRFEETVAIGIRTALPFIASHRGCAMSEVLGGADLGRDHTFGAVSVWDGDPHRFRNQSYEGGEFDSGLFQGFSDTGGNDVDYVMQYYSTARSTRSPRPYDERSLLQLLAEASPHPDA